MVKFMKKLMALFLAVFTVIFFVGTIDNNKVSVDAATYKVDKTFLNANFDALKAIILDSDVVNGYGYHCIRDEFDRSGITYDTAIYYNKSEKSISFFCGFSYDGAFSSVDMSLNKSRGTVTCSVSEMVNRNAYDAHTTFSSEDYDNDLDYNFTIDEISLGSVSDSQVQKLSNIVIDMAFLSWNVHLNSLGSSLEKLGFTSLCKDHDFQVSSKQAATLTSKGKTTYRCENCGSYYSKYTPKLKATIKLSATSKTIKAKKSFTLKVSNLVDGDSIKSVVSSSKKIATVKKIKKNQYKITGKKAGTVKITVTLKSGKEAVCKVKVK